MTTLFERAVALATKAHEGQVRKFEGVPYITHPLAVAHAFKAKYPNHPELEIAMSAAVLHDVLEDTTTSAAEILEATNEKVLALVVWLTSTTKSYNGLLPRSTRKEMEAARLSGAPELAKKIKMLDRLDNLKGMVKNPSPAFRKMYAAESFELHAGISDADTALGDEMLSEIWALKYS